jgi:hypothetical protein
MQKPLFDAFHARKSFFSHRASAVYPLRIRAYSNLHIVFLNYWLLKNNIPCVGINFRVYDSSGILRVRCNLDKVEDHNNVSVRDGILRPGGVPLPFDGMLEVEVVSSDNLSFPFPAILGVYESNGCFSSVHAAGRIKNSDEPKKPHRSQETNWSCIFQSHSDSGYSIAPFFHYFVGATPLPGDETLDVSLRDPSGCILLTRSIPVGCMAPFASRIFHVDEIFDLPVPPPTGSFVSVSLTAHDIFPRLVVGNFHREIDFLEVTHSFPVSEFQDYCPLPDASKPEGSVPSLLAAQTAPGLSLDVRVFPTNCEGQAIANVSCQRFGEERLRRQNELLAFDSSLGSGGLDFALEADEGLRVLHLQGNSIPSRLNASYRYRVAGAPRRFATDIATGAKSIVYPPKWRHWGHGCIGGGFDTVILLRNNTHAVDATLPNAGEIRIIGAEFDHKFKVEVGAEAGLVLRLSELLGSPLIHAPSPLFLSWLMTLSQPVGETFWVSFRPDGAVFGEHGF